MSFDGVRASTLTRSPDWRECRRTARQQPPVAPKRATVGDVDDDIFNKLNSKGESEG